MDTEKKSESNQQEPARLGPYRIQEQMPQAAHSRGTLYRATHETSGATALVLEPAEDDGVPLTDWRVRCISSVSPSYLALEVEHTSWSTSSGRHSVEALVCMFEDVREGVTRMVHAFSATKAPRPWWRLGLSLVGVAGMCALVFALVRLTPVSQPPGGTDPVARAVSVSYGVPMAAELPDSFTNGWFAGSSPYGEFVLAVPLPREPLKAQKRPPCIRYTEVELVGACWMPHKLKAPCPDTLYEHQGECYAPVLAAKPPPQSVGQ